LVLPAGQLFCGDLAQNDLEVKRGEVMCRKLVAGTRA
jgi:hypothetical protein